MITIDHFGEPTEAERKMILTIMNKFGQNQIHSHLNRPHLTTRSGAISDFEIPLAWLVLTFLGSGAASLAKSFIESIGKEMGQILIASYKKRFEAKKQGVRHNKETPYCPIVIMLETKHETHTAMMLSYNFENGFPRKFGNGIDDVLKKLDKANLKPGDKVFAYYDFATEEWDISINKVGPIYNIYFPEQT